MKELIEAIKYHPDAEEFGHIEVDEILKLIRQHQAPAGVESPSPANVDDESLYFFHLEQAAKIYERARDKEMLDRATLSHEVEVTMFDKPQTPAGVDMKGLTHDTE